MTLRRALGSELHFAVDQCEQSVILAHADVVTRVNARTALTDNDAASIDALTAVHLDAQSFLLGIAAVSRSAAAFFMCHVKLLAFRLARSRITR